MIIFGIVSEYNPMHFGHIYQIERIKKEYPDAYIISLTSASFVQRGEPSFIPKHSKSQIALDNGVDLVLEMPTIISIQSANYFSYYSCYLLNKLNILTHLSFGMEDLSKEDIENYIDFTNINDEKIQEAVKNYMDLGYSYKLANYEAYKDLAYEKIDSIIKPNNSLGLLYSKALDMLGSSIEISPIERSDRGYHEESLSEDRIQSASSIRKAYLSGENIQKYLPFNIDNYKEELAKVSLDDLSKIFYYKSFIEEKKPDCIASYENGLLTLLKSHFSNSLEEMIGKSHNKRYSKSRLRRFILNYILGISEIDISNLKHLSYIRPLAFNNKGRELLRLIKDNSDVTIINKPSKAELDPINQRFLEIDMKAFMLYNINKPSRNNLDYTINPFKEKRP